MLTPQQPPPEDYYQNNCRELFGFVLQQYAPILDASARRNLEVFLRLDDPAQRLFARLLSRKGPFIRCDRLDYREVDDLAGALDALLAAGLIELNPTGPGDLLLGLLRKAELQEGFAYALRTRNGLRKDQLISRILSSHSDRQVHSRCAACCSWLVVADPACWDLVRLLYFGESAQDWSAFVIRDLGMVRYEDIRVNQVRFSTARALAVDLHLRRLSRLSHRLEEFPQLAPELSRQLMAFDPAYAGGDRIVENRRQRTLLRLGRWLERQGEMPGALAVYACASMHPARERMVRILTRCGNTEAAEQLLREIGTNPRSEEELQFAKRFGKRSAGYTPPQTELEISAVRSDVEQQALELLTRSGGWGAHVENSLIRTLTGLLYWPAVFADVNGAFYNPFQNGPSDLFEEDFALQRTSEIEHIEQLTRDDVALREHLLRVSREKWGVAHRLVSWQLLEQLTLEVILEVIPADHIRRLCAFMIRNLRTHRKGMPDLLLVHPCGRYELVEVKGPTDQLQPAQRVWFKDLQRLHIPARVVKLRLASA